MSNKDWHYYESHITIEPVFDKRLEEFKTVCQRYGFHVAELLMQKRKKSRPERSNKDAFCTGRSSSFSYITTRTKALAYVLKQKDFKVWRAKIEYTLMDTRHEDCWNIVS